MIHVLDNNKFDGGNVDAFFYLTGVNTIDKLILVKVGRNLQAKVLREKKSLICDHMTTLPSKLIPMTILILGHNVPFNSFGMSIKDLFRLVTIKAALYKIKNAEPAAEINPKFVSSILAKPSSVLRGQLQPRYVDILLIYKVH